MTCSNTAWVPQKHPPAKMATCVEDFCARGASTVGAGSGALGAEGIPEKARATYQTSKPATVTNTSERARSGGLEASSIVRSQAAPRAARSLPVTLDAGAT